MKVLLTGAHGQLAQDISRCWTAHEILGFSRESLDIGDLERVNEVVQQVRPDLIVNTASFHFVDQCEERFADAFHINVTAVANLARVAEQTGAIFVQFSTDYVFDGTKRSPYVESDPTGPLSTYAESRVAGEWVTQHYCKRSYVIRTCGLYGLGASSTRSGNFVETMLRAAKAGKPLRVVDDQIVTPTSTLELAQKLLQLVPAAPYGIYHMSNVGECSWYEFAREIFRLAGLSPLLSPVTAAEYNAPARRPAYSVLDNARLRDAGISEFRPWQLALAEYLRLRGSA
jgi:dTDP-4-dehydrorhamnose reductase